MERCRILPVVLTVVAIAAVCALENAQAVQDSSAETVRVKPLTEAVRAIPFPPVFEEPGQGHSIEVRAADRMTQKDRDLAADAESSIGERAGFADLGFNEGKWSYRQLVCPALPNHLFLRFTRNDGAGDASVFTASIPRDGEGHVRIIPILRRGYSLFSPAPINALTIAAFNRIRGEEHSDKAPDWLGTGLCYAALAGANPQAAPLAGADESQRFFAAPPAVLEIPVLGGAVIRLTDVSVAARPMEWTLTFNSKGRLLKATHLPASLVKEQTIQTAPVDVRGTPLHETLVDSRGALLQPTAPAVVVMPIAPAPAVRAGGTLPRAPLNTDPVH